MQKISCGLELRWRAQHRTETAGLPRDPEQQQYADCQHEWRADAFKKFDGLDTSPDHGHVQRPKTEKTDPLKISRAGPNDFQHRVDGLAADPGLNSEPTAE